MPERPSCACHGQPMWSNGSGRGQRKWVCRVKESERNATRIRIGPGDGRSSSIFLGRTHQFGASKQHVKALIESARKGRHGTHE